MKLISLFNRRSKPPAPISPLVLAFQQASHRLGSRAERAVRSWETQPLTRRKTQLIGLLVFLLLLSSLSVYYTASGHFFTQLTKKSHEQRSTVRPGGTK